jgi:hypothetical protein
MNNNFTRTCALLSFILISTISYSQTLTISPTSGTYAAGTSVTPSVTLVGAVGQWDITVTAGAASNTCLNATTCGLPAFTLTSTTVISASATKGASTVNASVTLSLPPLPVELVSVSAEVKGGQAHLTWLTASELDNDYFDVERSLNGKAFTTVGQVKGNGTTKEAVRYAFVDETPAKGINYYRLKQVDFSGEHKFSKIVAASNGDSKLSIIRSNNLVRDENVNIQYFTNREEAINLKVMDSNGRIVYTKTLSANEGLNAAEIVTQNLSSGIFILSLSNLQNVETLKLVKL